jgi:hypothetical protein
MGSHIILAALRRIGQFAPGGEVVICGHVFRTSETRCLA